MPAGKRARIPPFSKVANSIRRNVTKVADTVLYDFAVDMRDVMVTGIYRQRFRSFILNPINKSYKKWKESIGLDGRVMISTAQYVDSITVIPVEHARYEVGIHDNIAARDHKGNPVGITLKVLGAVHEYGSQAAHVPPRPHWADGFQEAQLRAPAISNKIATEAAAKIRRELQG